MHRRRHGKSHTEKMAASAAAFDSRLTENVQQYQTSFPHQKQRREDRRQREVEAAQQDVNEAAAALVARYSTGGSEPCLPLIRLRTIVYIGLGFKGVLQVPMYEGGPCGRVTVHPFQAGCTPTTATEACETWISVDLILAFRDMSLTNGLSADGACASQICDPFVPSRCVHRRVLLATHACTLAVAAFVHTLDNLERHYDPSGNQVVDADGQRSTATLKAEQLVMAMMEFSKVESTASAVHQATSDPFLHCPCCAVPAREALNNGETAGPCFSWPLQCFLPYITTASSRRRATAGRPACRDHGRHQQRQPPCVSRQQHEGYPADDGYIPWRIDGQGVRRFLQRPFEKQGHGAGKAGEAGRGGG